MYTMNAGRDAEVVCFCLAAAKSLIRTAATRQHHAVCYIFLASIITHGDSLVERVIITVSQLWMNQHWISLRPKSLQVYQSMVSLDASSKLNRHT